jgi:fructokinase
MILGIQQHWDWQTTLERAQQFASLIVTQRGATCSNLTRYKDFSLSWQLI